MLQTQYLCRKQCEHCCQTKFDPVPCSQVIKKILKRPMPLRGKGCGFGLSTHIHGCAAAFFLGTSVGPTSRVMAAETVWPIRNGTGGFPKTWMGTGKRCGRRNPSAGMLIAGHRPVVSLPEPS